jgi:hypothetical protein
LFLVPAVENCGILWIFYVSTDDSPLLACPRNC